MHDFLLLDRAAFALPPWEQIEPQRWLLLPEPDGFAVELLKIGCCIHRWILQCIGVVCLNHLKRNKLLDVLRAGER